MPNDLQGLRPHRQPVSPKSRVGEEQPLVLIVDDELCCINRRKQAGAPCTPLLAHRRGQRTTQFPHPIE
jgi:hypothetical protein